jgi:hypothetical protein
LEVVEDAEYTGDRKQIASIAVALAAILAIGETEEWRSPFDLAGQIAACAQASTEDPGKESSAQAVIIRDIFGNLFRPVTFDSDWHTSTAVALAQQIYDSRDFSAMPILADALQDAGCDNADILDHCREPGPHVRGCWVVDLVLDKS